MEIGSFFDITLIADDRFEKFGTKDVNIQIASLDQKLKETLKENGMIIQMERPQQVLTGWGEPGNPGYNTIQIRKLYRIELTEKKTTNQIYGVINQVAAQPLKIYNNKKR